MEEAKAWLHSFLTSALDTGECLISRYAHFTHGIHFIVGWVSHTAGFYVSLRRENLLYIPVIEPRTIQPVD